MTTWSSTNAAPYLSRCVFCSAVIPAGCFLCMTCLDSDLAASFLFRTGMDLSKKPSTARDL